MTRIMFLRDSAGFPCGCVAISLEQEKQTAHYGLSVLNPADRFDRKLAREIALGRLASKPEEVSLKEGSNMHDISTLVMENIVGSKQVPARAVKAAQRWLRTPRPQRALPEQVRSNLG